MSRQEYRRQRGLTGRSGRFVLHVALLFCLLIDIATNTREPITFAPC
jgi:hypothetical protein